MAHARTVITDTPDHHFSRPDVLIARIKINIPPPVNDPVDDLKAPKP